VSGVGVRCLGDGSEVLWGGGVRCLGDGSEVPGGGSEVSGGWE